MRISEGPAAMEGKLAETGATFSRFKDQISKNNVDEASRLLSQLKLQLTEFSALPPLYERTPTAQQELLLARDILEHAVVLSVKLEDEAAFERNFLQLKTYYTDTRDRLPPSGKEAVLLGLNLLRLLVQNRIAEFHTELELLPPAAAQDGACVQFAVDLEQSLMEGAYYRVLSARQRMPDPIYAHLMDLLVVTVRDEIAGCMVKAYTALSAEDSMKMLSIAGRPEFDDYAAAHEWKVQDGRVLFQETNRAVSALTQIPAAPLITQTVGYAKELERIV